MKCAKCGAEIRTGCVYCSNCGQEAQIVTEINVLEDDLLRSMMEEEDSKKQLEQQKMLEEKKKEEESRKRRAREEKKRRRRRKNLLVMILILLILGGSAIGYGRYRQMHSVDYLMEKAQTAFSQKNYQDALEYLDNTVSLEPGTQEALLMQGEIYTRMKDYDQAEELFLTVIGLDASSKEAYSDLLNLYGATGSYDKIVTLKATVTDADILALFADYLVAQPEIDKEGGSYAEYFDVTLSAPEKNLEIYYTLDGSDPAENGVKYEDPISIEEQGSITLTAVCCDQNGNYSEPVSEVYVISLKNPDKPQVSPDGGQFTTPVSVRVTVPEGVSVYYTWDGSIPTERSEKYTGSIEVPEGNNILSLIAVDQYGMKSAVLKCNYIYYPE
jgi:tetratricopeptide (TPR) repeat protein